MPPLAALVLAVALALTPSPRAGPTPPAAGSTTGSTTVPVGVWPLQPQPAVVAPFDPPTSPYGPGHRGVDLLGSPGQPVHAALPGTVTYAGLLAGRGVVVVDHGATRTTYQPVAASLPVGATVAAGAVLGTLELPGSHCFPRACLHWGWILGAATYLDPLLLVGLGPVRLLPLGRAEPGMTTSSGARVGLTVGGAEPVGGDVGVELGRGQ